MSGNQARTMQLLSLSSKAGKVLSGEFQCEEGIRRQAARIVLVASDASGNTRKKFSDKCEFYHVPFFILDCGKAELGRAIGREQRSCAAVTDEGLAGIIEKSLNV